MQKTRSATEPSAEPPLTRKGNTLERVCAGTLSAKHDALRDEIAHIARRTGLCADIEVLVDHPAIDPENGARMDVRISKPGVQNSDGPTDAQVTSPFCVEAAGLVGKPESKNRMKYRPAVFTLAFLATHGRMGPTLKAFLAKVTPEDQQVRATWLQEAVRRISGVLQILPSPNATDPSDSLFAWLSLALCALFLAPVLCDPCLLVW